MKLSINFRNMRGSGALLGYIDKRLSFAFSRLRHEIQSTSITLSDINGPNGGTDKECKVVVKPFGLRSIVVTERRSNARQAVYRCLARAGYSLRKKLQRRSKVLSKAVLPAPG